MKLLYLKIFKLGKTEPFQSDKSEDVPEFPALPDCYDHSLVVIFDAENEEVLNATVVTMDRGMLRSFSLDYQTEDVHKFAFPKSWQDSQILLKYLHLNETGAIEEPVFCVGIKPESEKFISIVSGTTRNKALLRVSSTLVQSDSDDATEPQVMLLVGQQSVDMPDIISILI